jgi:hypothetical protein
MVFTIRSNGGSGSFCTVFSIRISDSSGLDRVFIIMSSGRSLDGIPATGSSGSLNRVITNGS